MACPRTRGPGPLSPPCRPPPSHAGLDPDPGPGSGRDPWPGTHEPERSWDSFLCPRLALSPGNLGAPTLWACGGPLPAFHIRLLREYLDPQRPAGLSPRAPGHTKTTITETASRRCTQGLHASIGLCGQCYDRCQMPASPPSGGPCDPVPGAQRCGGVEPGRLFRMTLGAMSGGEGTMGQGC